MKHSIITKFILFLLTALMLIGAVGAGIGIYVLEEQDLYRRDSSVILEDALWSEASFLSRNYAGLLIAQQRGDCPDFVLEALYTPEENYYIENNYFHVRLFDAESDALLASFGSEQDGSDYFLEEIHPLYPVVLTSEYAGSDAPGVTVPTLPDLDEKPTEPQTAPQPTKEPEKSCVYTQTLRIRDDNGVYRKYRIGFYESDVTLYAQVKLHPSVPVTSYSYWLLQLYSFRYWLIGILAACLVLFAAGVVALISIAGKQKDGSVQMRGLNRLPLDLFFAICGLTAAGIMWQESAILSHLEAILSIFSLCLGGLAVSLLAIACLYTLSAQIKMGGCYWWHHSITGFCADKILGVLRFVFRGAAAILRLLPAAWKWMLCSVILLLLLSFAAADRNGALFLLGLVLCFAATCYACYCMAALLNGVRKLSEGDLNHKVSTRYLCGSFREFADRLNSLSDTVKRSAEESLRSERMKTELITNVSHDIKTPLTSIINFVDLLCKPHSPEQEQQYLEVLSRQSSQMKKLIEDLIALSKANTGNMQVDLAKLDLTEALTQALGEYADKLENADLIPVFRHPEEKMYVLADGRLTWRVISNLLSNAVKYALPGTRVYLELTPGKDAVELFMKNISREEIHVSADELMERFVRGDDSRSTGGSGLGLNIAKSLMEVQGGSMELQLDGDLFKILLRFPRP